MMKKKKSSHFITDEVKKNILEIKKDGLYPTSIARYLGLPLSIVKYYFNPDAYHKATARWKEKNLKKDREYNRGYHETRKKFSPSRNRKQPGSDNGHSK